MEERINFFPKKVVIEVSARTCRNFIMDTCLDDFMDYMCVISVTTSPIQKTAHGLMTARVCRMIKEINDNLSD